MATPTIITNNPTITTAALTIIMAIQATIIMATPTIIAAALTIIMAIQATIIMATRTIIKAIQATMVTAGHFSLKFLVLDRQELTKIRRPQLHLCKNKLSFL